MNTIQALAHEQTPEHLSAVASRWTGPVEPDPAAWDVTAPPPEQRDSPEARLARGTEHRGWVDMAQERVEFWLRGVERADRGEELESMDQFMGELEREHAKRRRENDWGAPDPTGWGDGAKWSNDGKNGWGGGAWDTGEQGWGTGGEQEVVEKKTKGKQVAPDNAAGQNGWDAWDATMEAGPSRLNQQSAQSNPAGQNGWDLWDPKMEAEEAHRPPAESPWHDNPAGQNGWDLWDPTAQGAAPTLNAAEWHAADNPGGQYGWEPWDPTQAHDGNADWPSQDDLNPGGQYGWEPWDPTAEGKGTTPKKPVGNAWAQSKLWVHPATSRESSPASTGNATRQTRRQREPFSKLATGRNTERAEQGPAGQPHTRRW
ncbi:hypothetical protein PENSPDRAFT_645735 [Peniophora sp. CONT]|nr:hypothetical protein PENSPDRAFT_645735 [Peniophora sp. CONT]